MEDKKEKHVFFEVGQEYKNLYESCGWKDDENFILRKRTLMTTNDVDEITLKLYNHKEKLDKKVYFYLKNNVLKEIVIDDTNNVLFYTMFR